MAEHWSAPGSFRIVRTMQKPIDIVQDSVHKNSSEGTLLSETFRLCKHIDINMGFVEERYLANRGAPALA